MEYSPKSAHDERASCPLVDSCRDLSAKEVESVAVSTCALREIFVGRHPYTLKDTAGCRAKTILFLHISCILCKEKGRPHAACPG